MRCPILSTTTVGIKMVQRIRAPPNIRRSPGSTSQLSLVDEQFGNDKVHHTRPSESAVDLRQTSRKMGIRTAAANSSDTRSPLMQHGDWRAAARIGHQVAMAVFTSD